jgi:SRSO17 transposase
MNRDDDQTKRFENYLGKLAESVGHADRREPLRGYCTGLLLPGRRKSVEPMAARIDPVRVGARHQSLHHFVAKSTWSDEALMRVAREYALPEMERHGPLDAWLVDDTGMPKKGRYSVGVANQYCGVLGKNANCQVAVSLSVTNEVASLPVAYRLYLPKKWAEEPDGRKRTGIPDEVGFQRKWEIALAQIDFALACDDLPRGTVVADAGYGDATGFRDGLAERKLPYVVGVSKTTHAWPPGAGPLPPEPYTGHGRPPTRMRRTPDHQPVTVLEIASSLAPNAWQEVTWRTGSRGDMRSRFTAVRVRTSHRDFHRTEPRPEEWLLVEWPEGEDEPTDYWLASEPEDIALAELVRRAKLRWRIERDYQELKQEVGLGHYEGRGWRGFHHHASLCIAAYAFLVAERARLSPPDPGAFAPVEAPPVPAGFNPRGSPGSR